MEDWSVRCRRLVREYQGTGLLPADINVDSLAERLLRETVPSGRAGDLWLLKEISPRLRAAGDTECIYEDSSYADFARPFARLAEDVLGPVDLESRYDGHAEKAFLTFRAQGREHSVELEQSLDYADIGGVLAGLNQFVGPSDRSFYYIDEDDGFVGFLSEADAAFLRKKGYSLLKGGDPLVEPEEPDPDPTPPPVATRTEVKPAAPQEQPSRRTALGGAIVLLGAGAVFLLKTYVSVQRGMNSAKPPKQEGIPLASGESLTGRELFDQPGRVILEVRSTQSGLRASFTTYDFRKEDETAASERLKQKGVAIPAGSVQRIGMKAEAGVLLWAVRNDGPNVASVDVRVLYE